MNKIAHHDDPRPTLALIALGLSLALITVFLDDQTLTSSGDAPGWAPHDGSHPFLSNPRCVTRAATVVPCHGRGRDGQRAQALPVLTHCMLIEASHETR